jgi:hypothetical protein
MVTTQGAAQLPNLIHRPRLTKPQEDRFSFYAACAIVVRGLTFPASASVAHARVSFPRVYIRHSVLASQVTPAGCRRIVVICLPPRGHRYFAIFVVSNRKRLGPHARAECLHFLSSSINSAKALSSGLPTIAVLAPAHEWALITPWERNGFSWPAKDPAYRELCFPFR